MILQDSFFMNFSEDVIRYRIGYWMGRYEIEKNRHGPYSADAQRAIKIADKYAKALLTKQGLWGI